MAKLLDSQIVESLLQFYKQRGVDLHYILDDPVFATLPLQAKIDAIKQHADTIAKGTHPGFGPEERGTMVTQGIINAAKGGITGAMVGSSLNVVARGLKPWTAPLLGASTGAVVGAFTGLLDSRRQESARKALLAQLQAVARDPSDSNALGALSIRGIHNRNHKNVDEAYRAIREAIGIASSPSMLEHQIGRLAQEVEAKNLQAATPAQ